MLPCWLWRNTHSPCCIGGQLSRPGRSSSLANHQSCVVVGELPGRKIMMSLIAQIALGVIIGGLTLTLLATGFIMWMQDRKKGKERLAVELLVAGAIIVVVLVAIAVIQ